MTKFGYFALVVAGLAMAGLVPAAASQSTPGPTQVAESLLPEVRWELSEAALADGTVHAPDDPELYTIQFLPGGEVIARADCNQVAGAYGLDGDSLGLSGLTTTLAGCPEGSLGADYAAWLDQISGFELTDDALLLDLDDGGELRFTPSLTGVTWEWQRFLGGNNSVVAPQQPDHFTLQFDDGPERIVSVRADCNAGSGGFVQSGPAISIGGLALTDAYCGNGSLDREFLRLLDEVTSFTFLEGRLVLALPVDAGVLIFEARAIDNAATPVAGGTPASN